MKFRFPTNGLSSNTLILLVTLFLVASCNLTFFANILHTYPLFSYNAAYVGSLVVSFVAINALILALLCFGRLTKPVLILFLLLSSLAAYFMDSYGVIINDEMLLNYNGMLRDVFTLLTESKARIQAHVQAIEARRDFWLAQVDLHVAVVGGGAMAGAGASVSSGASPEAGGH